MDQSLWCTVLSLTLVRMERMDWQPHVWYGIYYPFPTFRWRISSLWPLTPLVDRQLTSHKSSLLSFIRAETLLSLTPVDHPPPPPSRDQIGAISTSFLPALSTTSAGTGQFSSYKCSSGVCGMWIVNTPHPWLSYATPLTCLRPTPVLAILYTTPLT